MLVSKIEFDYEEFKSNIGCVLFGIISIRM